MRSLTLNLSLLTLTGLLAACGGKSETGANSKDGNPCDANPELCANESDSGGPSGPKYITPVAVGFEVDVNIDDQGNLLPVRYSDGSTSPPFLKMIFADEEFFSLSGDQQEGHYCEVAASLDPASTNGYGAIATPQDSSDPAFGTLNGSILNWSYDVRPTFAWTFQGTDCAGLVDPDLYGADASGLITPFQGAHIGFGFAPMTDYLWDAWGGEDSPDNAEYVDKFFGMYVAINDRDGHWGGCDWVTGLVFETDDDGIAIADDQNQLIPIPVDTIGTGGLPKGYIRTFAYWYQDFPLMDFSNLTNDPVPSQTWLCE